MKPSPQRRSSKVLALPELGTVCRPRTPQGHEASHRGDAPIARQRSLSTAGLGISQKSPTRACAPKPDAAWDKLMGSLSSDGTDSQGAEAPLPARTLNRRTSAPAVALMNLGAKQASCPNLHRRPKPAQTATAFTTKEAPLSESRRRSQLTLSTMYDLRRIGQNGKDACDPYGSPPRSPASTECPGTPHALGSPPPSPHQGTSEVLFKSVLKNLTDTAASLQELDAELSASAKNIAECQGALHPSTIMATRAVPVVRRKMTLLRQVEARIKAIESTKQRREEIWKQLVAGSGTVPDELTSTKTFILQNTHTDGELVDADKSDFEAFCASFKLPHDHASLLRLRALANEIIEWWLDECIRERTTNRCKHAVVSVLFDAAVEAGVDREHPKMVTVSRMLVEALADRVLEEAQAKRQVCLDMSDEEVGPASVAADEVEALALRAEASGLTMADCRLEEATAIIKELRALDGMRKRVRGRRASKAGVP